MGKYQAAYCIGHLHLKASGVNWAEDIVKEYAQEFWNLIYDIFMTPEY